MRWTTGDQLLIIREKSSSNELVALNPNSQFKVRLWTTSPNDGSGVKFAIVACPAKGSAF